MCQLVCPPVELRVGHARVFVNHSHSIGHPPDLHFENLVDAGPRIFLLRVVPLDQDSPALPFRQDGQARDRLVDILNRRFQQNLVMTENPSDSLRLE